MTFKEIVLSERIFEKMVWQFEYTCTTGIGQNYTIGCVFEICKYIQYVGYSVEFVKLALFYSSDLYPVIPLLPL